MGKQEAGAEQKVTNGAGHTILEGAAQIPGGAPPAFGLDWSLVGEGQSLLPRCV